MELPVWVFFMAVVLALALRPFAVRPAPLVSRAGRR